MRDDYEGAYEHVNFDCLGCLLDAKAQGIIDEDIFAEVTAEPLIEVTPCPKCGGDAFISEIEPTMAHCTTCGLYLAQEALTGIWLPFIQGHAHTRGVQA